MSADFETALRYVRDEHNKAVELRDQLFLSRTKAMEYGSLTEALHAETLIAKYNGLIEGLTVATVQLQMVRDNERIDHERER